MEDIYFAIRKLEKLLFVTFGASGTIQECKEKALIKTVIVQFAAQVLFLYASKNNL